MLPMQAAQFLISGQGTKILHAHGAASKKKLSFLNVDEEKSLIPGMGKITMLLRVS